MYWWLGILNNIYLIQGLTTFQSEWIKSVWCTVRELCSRRWFINRHSRFFYTDHRTNNFCKAILHYTLSLSLHCCSSDLKEIISSSGHKPCLGREFGSPTSKAPCSAQSQRRNFYPKRSRCNNLVEFWSGVLNPQQSETCSVTSTKLASSWKTSPWSK